MYVSYDNTYKSHMIKRRRLQITVKCFKFYLNIKTFIVFLRNRNCLVFDSVLSIASRRRMFKLKRSSSLFFVGPQRTQYTRVVVCVAKIIRVGR